MSVWRVRLSVDGAMRVEAFVVADSASDAGVILGDHVRVVRGVGVDGQAGISGMDVWPAVPELAREAFNGPGRAAVSWWTDVAPWPEHNPLGVVLDG